MKYEFIETKNKVIALTKDAGKTIRGVAKCAPEDAFDLEFGKKLARARAAEKVTLRRLTRAIEHRDNLRKEIARLIKIEAALDAKVSEESIRHIEAENEVIRLENPIGN